MIWPSTEMVGQDDLERYFSSLYLYRLWLAHFVSHLFDFSIHYLPQRYLWWTYLELLIRGSLKKVFFLDFKIFSILNYTKLKEVLDLSAIVRENSNFLIFSVETKRSFLCCFPTAALSKTRYHFRFNSFGLLWLNLICFFTPLPPQFWFLLSPNSRCQINPELPWKFH